MDRGAGNLLKRPRQVGVAPWILLCATTGSGPASPLGGGRAVRLCEAGTTSGHEVRQSFAGQAGETYSFSCLCQADTRRWVNLLLRAGDAEAAWAWFNLADGTIGEAVARDGVAGRMGVAMEALADGWFLCRVTCRMEAVPPSGIYTVSIQLGDAQGRGSYRGNGTGGLFIAEPHVGAVAEAAGVGEAGHRFVNATRPAARLWRAPQGKVVGREGAVRLALEPAMSVRSADFPVAYPELVNADILDWGAKHAMEMSWKKEHFPARQVDVFRLPGGYLCNEGIVFDAELRVIQQSTQYHHADLIAHCHADLRARLAAGQVNRQPGASVVVKRPASHNYGHYMAEIFSRAAIINRMLGDYAPGGRAPTYIVNRLVPGILDTVYQSLRQIGVGLDQLLVQDHDPVWCEELFLADGVTEHGGYMSPLCVGAMEVAAARIAPGPRRKLFVRRRSAQGRGLLNEDRLEERLRAAGYEVVEPGAMGFREQVAAFRGADAVVGVLGAAMTNIGFCDPGTPVAIVTAATFPDTFFWFIAQHKAMPYLEVRCDLAEGSDRTSGSPDFIIRDADIGMLARFGAAG